MTEPLDLYGLLPAHHRRRDAERGEPLRALLRLLGEQGAIVRHGIDALADDLFIETCDRWVIPYIGRLVANDPLHDADPRAYPDIYRRLFPDLAGPDLRPPFAVPVRADVAKTIYYRRRKGTPPMLEELGRDISGWWCKVAEFFELLEWNQNDDHVRLHSPLCPDVRNVERSERTDGPFDPWAHTADVRRIAQHEGWHNIRSVGFFLWRLRSYPLERVTPRPVDPTDANEWRFHFSPLGIPAPLFMKPRALGDDRGRVEEVDVPGPIRRAFLYDDFVRYRNGEGRPRPDHTDIYGPPGIDRSVQIWEDGVELPPSPNPDAAPDALVLNVVCRRLDPWPATRPSGDLVAIDPACGRLAFGQDYDPNEPFEVSYGYGFSADLGGGPYERRAWLVDPDKHPDRVTVGRPGGASPPDHGTLTAALAAWTADGRPDRVVTVLDSRTYDMPAEIALAGEGSLVIQAADGQRPLLVTATGGLELTATAPGAGAEPRASLTLSGVVVEGHVRVTGDLRRLRLLHATVVPGRRLGPDTGGPASTEPSIRVEGEDADAAAINLRFRLELAFAITGGLRIPAGAEGMWVYDSIVDGVPSAGGGGVAIAGSGGDDSAAPPATLERVTVLGAARFRELSLASESIFTDRLVVDRRQGGCVRFSRLAPGSATPRRFRCQPDLAIADARERAVAAGTTLDPAEEDAIRSRMVPVFTDVRYGQPGYAQLSRIAAAGIRTGAEDGSEMGAFSHLRQPHRETNLRIRLREYLPFGLVPGLIYVT